MTTTDANDSKVTAGQPTSKQLRPPTTDHPVSTYYSESHEELVSNIRGKKNWVQEMASTRKQALWRHEELTSIELESSDLAYVEQSGHRTMVASQDSLSPTAISIESANVSCQFGPGESRKHIYPVSLEASTATMVTAAVAAAATTAGEAERSIVGDQPRDNGWFEVSVRPVLKMVVHAAVCMFVVALCVALRYNEGSQFIWHPILMCGMLVLTTEATVALQHVPRSIHRSHAPRKTLLIKVHTLAQCLAGVMGVAGIVQGAVNYEEAVALSEIQNSSAHRRVGAVGLVLFVAQISFRAYIAMVSRRLGVHNVQSRQFSKYWHKYHRVLGYLTLIFLWSSAWLGVHSYWIRTRIGGYSATAEVVWFLIFAALIFGILAPADLHKMGIK